MSKMRKPRQLLRGKKVLDYLTGEEIYQYDSNTVIQDGQYRTRRNYDTLTEDERQRQIEGMMR